MSEEQTAPGQEEKKATEKAMNLLLRQDRTKKELQDRLYRAGFSERAAEYALAYVTSFGYIDDFRYATNYITYHKERRSKKELRYKLLQKGVEPAVLAMAFEEYESADEREAIRRLLEKRLKGKRLSDLEYTERNKTAAYLSRKGFDASMIRSVMSECEKNSESN
jgi:regulatory protein